MVMPKVSKLGSLLLAVVLLSVAPGCLHATPVTPAPLADDKQAELRTALIG
jgi:hypothetical protein